MKEYIILVAQCDKQFNETVNGVITGVIEEININRQDANPFIREVPQPPKPDDSAYLKSLEGEDKRIFDIYKELPENNDEAKLIRLVKSQELRPDSRNREQQTPLMFAVDNSFSSDTISELIQLGCDVNAQGEDGMTALHTSIWCDNKETFKLLLKNGADIYLKD